MPQSFLLYACVLLLAASTLPISCSSLQPIHKSPAISQYCSHKQAPPMGKGPWSPEEDEQLTSMVKKHGADHWSYISTGVPGRTGKSCRRRWCNHLSLAVQDPRPFTAEEHALSIRESQCQSAAAQFAHTNVAAAASAAAAAAENNLPVWGKGKAVVIDVEDDEPPPAKRQRVSNEGGGTSAGGDADAWLTLSLGMPLQQQPVEQAPVAPVATETPAVMAAMREMVSAEVERQARQLVVSVFMAARGGQP